MQQTLTPDGELVGALPEVDDSELVRMYELMLAARLVDRRAYAAQRQGRLGTYPMIEGHEAAQVGAAVAFGPKDFLYPGYRELGAQIARGVPLRVLLDYWTGRPNTKWNPDELGMMSITVPIGSHLPHAVGHAYQKRLIGDDTVTGAFIGDGGTSENDFHSALNFAGVWKTPTVFICQNNGYAISVPYNRQTASETIAEKASAYGMPGVRVDGMDVLAVYSATREAVEKARRGEGPTLIEAVCYRFGAHATADDASRYRSDEETDEWRPRDPLVRMERFLETRDLWSSQQSQDLESAVARDFETTLKEIEAEPLPEADDIVRHVFERIPAQLVEQLQRLEGSRGNSAHFGSSEIWTSQDEEPEDQPTESMTMAEAINSALRLAMEADPTVALLGEDVGQSGGVFRVTEGLFDTFGGGRVLDTPLNESGIIGSAIGMAIAGGRPIAEIQFDGFVYPGFDQVASHLGRIRFRTRGHVQLPIVLRFPSGPGIGAHEHHCDSPEAYFVQTPGLIVVVPSNPYDAKGLLAAAIASNDPVVFLEPKVLYRSGRQQVPVGHYEIPLGKARVAVEGSDATVVTYGATAPKCVSVAEDLDGAGHSVEVIDLRTVFPWDVETVVESVRKTGRLLVVQEAKRSAGIASEVAAEVGERCGWELDSPIRRLTGTDAPWPQFSIETHALITEEMIKTEVESLLAS